uniref:Multiple EGF like domains 9 n=1 Tax=Salvator merianae TaxID=96440 RepID=A0A8D0BUW0_SALMN
MAGWRRHPGAAGGMRMALRLSFALLLAAACALALEIQPWTAAAAAVATGPEPAGGRGASAATTWASPAAAAGTGGGLGGGGAAPTPGSPPPPVSPSLPPPPPPGLLLSPSPPPHPPEAEEEEGEAAEGNELSSWAATAAGDAPGPPLPTWSSAGGEDDARAGPSAGAPSPAPSPSPSFASPVSSPSAPPEGPPETTASASIPATPRPSAPVQEEEEAEEEGEDGGESVVHSGTDLFCNCSSVGSTGPNNCDIRTGQCECRTGYVGHVCDQCDDGYYADRGSGRCLPCGCHLEGSLSSACNKSGRCHCKTGATGPKCAQCQEGYSRFNGTACEPCRCNNHSVRCDPQTEPGHPTPVCDKCRPGYRGIHCNQCDNGYYSSDSICVRCQCNGNVDPILSPQICKADTGECLGCLYHTAGHHCEKCQEGYVKHLEDGNCTKKEHIPGPQSRGLTPSAANASMPTSLSPTVVNSTFTPSTTPPLFPVSSSDNSTSALADVSWTQFNIIILTVIIILVVLLMGFVGAVYMYREYQNRKLNAPFWTIELKEDNISFSSYHDSIPNADVSGLLEDDGNEVTPNGQLTLATPMHNYKP